MPDSSKAAMIGHFSVEFKSDGSYNSSKMGKDEKGTWKLSDYGKTSSWTAETETKIINKGRIHSITARPDGGSC